MINQSQWSSENNASATKSDDDINLLDYFFILWKRKWLIVCVFAGIVAVSIIVNLLLKPTYESESLLKIGAYKNAAIESTNDLRAIMYNPLTLKQLNDQLNLQSKIAAIANIFDIDTKKVKEKDGDSSYLQIKGRANTAEKAQTIVIAIQKLLLDRHKILLKEALEKFNFEIEQLNREKQNTEFQIKQKQQELINIENDIKFYSNEIKKRDNVKSEAQGRIAESYINLLASAKNKKDAYIIGIESLKQEVKNYDIKFQNKEFEKKYQTWPTSVEISANLPEDKIAPARRKNVIFSAVLAGFLGVFFAFAFEFASQHKSKFKQMQQIKNANNSQVPPSAAGLL